MSTIHACYTPNIKQPDERMTQMLAASGYWQPDKQSQLNNLANTCHVAKASLFTSERSRKDDCIADPNTGDMIAANARLDNRTELAAKLSITASDLEALTDSQLILLTYQTWGADCPKYLLGDFVFVVWDEARQRLFAARDHFGIKVLYYSHTADGIMVTNEHNALLTSGWQPKRLKESWIVRHLWAQGPQPVESAVENIDVLSPAHTLTMHADGTVDIRRYWSLEDADEWNQWEDEHLLQELRERFTEAVKCRLDTNYPLAAELSEGLDSNAIAGYAAALLGETRELMTFSYQCEALTDDNRHVWGQTYEDIEGMLALHKNLKPVWRNGAPLDFGQLQELLFRYHGAPSASKSSFVAIQQLASEQGARVLLSGWGGDHCVTAPGDFYADELFRAGRWMGLHQLFKAKHRRGRGGRPISAWRGILIKHLVPGLFRWRSRHYGGLEKALWERAESSPLKAQWIEKYQLEKALREFTDNYQPYSVKGYHRRELFDVGVEGRLVGSEQSARMFRIEYRYPMLDVRLATFCYNLPSRLKIKQGIERYPIRHILKGFTTERIRWRHKADVAHPNIDRDKHRASQIEDIRSLVSSSARLQEFICTKKLEAFGVDNFRVSPQFIKVLIDSADGLTDEHKAFEV